MTVNVEVVSCDEALNPLQGIRLQLAGQESGSSMITIHGHSGPYYTLKGHIIISTATVPSSVKIALSLRQQQQQIQPRALSSTSQAMLKLIGEDGQTPLRGWDDQDYIFMRALSGEVQIKRTSDKSPPTASSEKGTQGAFSSRDSTDVSCICSTNHRATYTPTQRLASSGRR